MKTSGTGKTLELGTILNEPGSGITYYHAGKKKRERRVNLDTKQFIAWDGEGINLAGVGKPQSYVLFGSSEGRISNRGGLGAFDCLDHIIATGRANPEAVHVGFAFSYDANMIVRSLSPITLERLHKHGYVRVTRASGERYTITFAPGKFFRVTKYGANYDAKKNPHDKTTVQIYDIFSFFACSFIKAYADMVGPVPEVITTGKANRRSFSLAAFDEMEGYWEVEIQLLRELAEELRRRFYNADMRISEWYGPGALATLAMRKHNIKTHLKEPPAAVRLAARYGYAGGRFEPYKVGRVVGPVYGVDINSAYPHAISQLPSWTDGEWNYTASPGKVKRYGIYHVRLRQGGGFVSQPSPLFHRDKDHNLSFPWFTDGWYFSPEAHIAQRCGAEILEGWEYTGSTERPFEWVTEMYETRRDWKRRGISAQLALKLCMNSMYGKLAQRVGWNETTRRIPPFHHLVSAGWVTSYVRGRLFNVMSQIPFSQLVAVETDGVYMTADPGGLGIESSESLGLWTVSEYQEVLYIQSGLAWLCDKDGVWTDKRRGLDPCREGHTPLDCHCAGTFSLGASRDYLQSLHSRPTRALPWQPYVGETTRFLGLGQSLASSTPMDSKHCVWETSKREIIPGYGGKRVHMTPACEACRDGVTAYERAHDLVISSRAILNPHSYPHAVPWEPGQGDEGHPVWRDYQDRDRGIRDV